LYLQSRNHGDFPTLVLWTKSLTEHCEFKTIQLYIQEINRAAKHTLLRFHFNLHVQIVDVMLIAVFVL
jgi:hypothetical protein